MTNLAQNDELKNTFEKVEENELSFVYKVESDTNSVLTTIYYPRVIQYLITSPQDSVWILEVKTSDSTKSILSIRDYAHVERFVLGYDNYMRKYKDHIDVDALSLATSIVADSLKDKMKEISNSIVQESISSLKKEVGSLTDSLSSFVAEKIDLMKQSTIDVQTTINEENKNCLESTRKLNELLTSNIQNIELIYDELSKTRSVINDLMPLTDNEIKVLQLDGDKIVNDFKEDVDDNEIK